ncbi:MAG TPA: hypothetical protein VHO69_02255 [Phototrophicaceae bacterium]|nr:hypothetical protein [Phototrophicaceae bacterium]
MTVEQAKTGGIMHLFEDRYSTQVKVYQLGDFSLEMGGGPHVEHTGTLGRFQIVKEEAVASGIRRIRAALIEP